MSNFFNMSSIFLIGFYGYDFKPQFNESENWKHWISIEDKRRCDDCEEHHGTIFPIYFKCKDVLPYHPYCRCNLQVMESIQAGTATIKGSAGADWYLFYLHKLPDYYITKNRAHQLHWKGKKGKLHEVAPDKYIGGDIYHNREGKLPKKSGRVWREADINYLSGYRNNHRILYSNDGLIFVTYNHYESFFEIV